MDSWLVLLNFYIIFYVGRFEAKPLCTSPNEESGPLANNAPLTPPMWKYLIWIGGSILFLSAHSSRCGSRGRVHDDLARPSSIGSASELTILTCRISEQQCCLEIDSVSRFTGFRRGKIENLSSVMVNCFFNLPFFSLYCADFVLTLHHRVQKKVTPQRRLRRGGKVIEPGAPGSPSQRSRQGVRRSQAEPRN